MPRSSTKTSREAPRHAESETEHYAAILPAREARKSERLNLPKCAKDITDTRSIRIRTRDDK